MSGEPVGIVTAASSGIGVRGSLTSEVDLQTAVDAALRQFGRLDGVVNNTGHAPGSSTPTGRRYDRKANAALLDISDGDWQQAFELFYMNVVRMARVVTPVLQKQGGGSIVNDACCHGRFHETVLGSLCPIARQTAASHSW